VGNCGIRIADCGTSDNNLHSKSAIQPSELATLVPSESLPAVQLFTDGACSGNPGPGGWAFILRHPKTGKEMERSGGEPLSTNNKMELTAAVEGLGALKSRSHVELLTDSVYVGKGMIEWLPKWKANGWKRKERNKLVPIANEPLWRKLDALLAKHQVKYTRVAGHSGHPENDRVDELAVAAYRQFL
jgi:ribonuclease HI